MKKFAAFDIDGTLIRWQLYHAVVNMLVKHGHFTPASAKEISAARMAWKQRESVESFRAYERILIDANDRVIQGLPVPTFLKAVDEVFEEYKDQVYVYTRELIRALRKEGYFLLAISGSQIEAVEKVARYYGFDDFIGTIYERRNGCYTAVKQVLSHDKRAVLLELIAKHNLTTKDSVAVGDTASDIPMLQLVERAIAFNPERQLFDVAKQNGWEVVVERKNVVYELTKHAGAYQLK